MKSAFSLIMKMHKSTNICQQKYGQLYHKTVFQEPMDFFICRINIEQASFHSIPVLTKRHESRLHIQSDEIYQRTLILKFIIQNN